MLALSPWGPVRGAAAEDAHWLDVDVVSRSHDGVVLRIANHSARPLHWLPPRGWGSSNYIKIGFEMAPFPRVLARARFTDVRPDLDLGLATVTWALPTLGEDGFPPGSVVDVPVPFPPPSARGNVELVVLARHGAQWLTRRQTVGTRWLLPGDAETSLPRGLLLALMGVLAYRSVRRAPREEAVRLPSTAAAVGHSAAVLLAAAVILLVLHQIHYRELPYTDGASYATLARSYAEGHGLVSPLVFPAFVTLVPTTREGQVFVMQAPLWPLLLGEVFRLFGASAMAVAVTGYALGGLTALGVWWIAMLASGRPGIAYLAVALLLSVPTYYAAISNGSTVPLQAALVTGLVLLMWAPLRLWSAVAAGVLTGLGLVARENTVFVAIALAVCWSPEALAALRRTESRRRMAVALLVGLACAAVPVAMEGARKAEALGGVGHPVVRATLLYGTGVVDPRWFWMYDYQPLKVSPLAFFRAHPALLWTKMRHQIAGVFLARTVGSLLTLSPWFVPIVLPWLLPSRARRAAGAFLLAMALQVIVGSASFLHPSYFTMFVPALCALVAASIGTLGERLFGARAPGRRAVLVGVLAYALAPLFINMSPMLEAGGVPMGDLQFDPRATERLFAFVREQTPPGAVIAFGHIPAPLLAWHTRRTVVSYDPAPDTRPSSSEMWRSLDRRLPLDYILLSSFTDADTSNVLEGFHLLATDETRWVKIWLFGRESVRADGSGVARRVSQR